MGVYTITIQEGNAALLPGDHDAMADVLRELARRFAAGQEPRKVMDANGNSIGTVEYERDD